MQLKQIAIIYFLPLCCHWAPSTAFIFLLVVCANVCAKVLTSQFHLLYPTQYEKDATPAKAAFATSIGVLPAFGCSSSCPGNGCSLTSHQHFPPGAGYQRPRDG
ncbi:hypothetical protein Q5H93_20245 [Hymenobacter sp. ASUV-10]|uniref:Secreted protein n=1 Tax=Hymenobacter aranciens TaxID=3063996 RepID=A0ABT9BFQ9_9BACT|nr:hypothetical protein [Hymenobacter sp. ASUV-10]MDO7877087.1 hypothetical protein [Hymenobacter sp. ASUV-10]